MKSFEEAQEVLKNLNPIANSFLRREAAARLREDWPEGEGLGTSDVSCECISMIRQDDFTSPDHDGSVLRALVEGNPGGTVEQMQGLFA